MDNHSMQKKTLVIVGNIASGKSTATRLLSEHFHLSRVDADDLFQTTDPFREVYLENMSRWAFANELWLTVERVKLIQKQLESSNQKLTVIDSGLLMSWVYTYSHYVNGIITKAEWELYEELYTHLAGHVLSQMMVVKLDYSVETLMKRIKKRGREYELDFYTPEYLKQINTGLEALERKLQKAGVKLLCIQESKIPDFEGKKKAQQAFFSTVATLLEK